MRRTKNKELCFWLDRLFNSWFDDQKWGRHGQRTFANDVYHCHLLLIIVFSVPILCSAPSLLSLVANYRFKSFRLKLKGMCNRPENSPSFVKNSPYLFLKAIHIHGILISIYVFLWKAFELCTTVAHLYFACFLYVATILQLSFSKHNF